MTPEISVVMANFNGARYLGAAIKSLQSQTFPHWELIFADDGSQDDSVALASGMADHDPRMRILPLKENQGPAAARNRAIEQAQGRWIVIFDSDDLMQPRRLEALRERARSDRAAIVADNLLVFSAEQPAGRPFLPRDYARAPRWIELAEYIDSGQLYSRQVDLGYLKPFISHELLRDSGVRYDETLRIGEDSDLLARLLAPGLRLRLEPVAHYMYRKHTNSISHRLHRDAILAMMEANQRLLQSMPAKQSEAAAALRRRDSSLQSLLLYDQVIEMLKTGNYGHAASASIGAPRIWPLLTRPLTARIGRLVEKIRRFPPDQNALSHAVE